MEILGFGEKYKICLTSFDMTVIYPSKGRGKTEDLTPCLPGQWVLWAPIRNSCHLVLKYNCTQAMPSLGVAEACLRVSPH